jgi:anti-sigma factor (TIGR02949 family)
MECWNVRQKVSAYLDNAVSEHERMEMRQHMSDCRDCARETERYLRVRQALRTLSKAAVPSDLTMRLRVVASKVRAESVRGESGWSRWRDRFQLTIKNLMRPLALPLAGGLCSAVVLFSALVPTFTSTYAMDKTPSLFDVPTMLATEPMVKYTAPVAFGETEAVVDLTIDDQGRITNYAIVSTAPGQKAEQVRRNIENKLLFIGFWPATTFGKPIAGTIRVSFGSSHVEVRG